MTTAIPTKVEKCKGAMLATAIGDALGWPNEPNSKNRIKKPKIVDHFVEWTRSSKNPRWHDEKILPGEYSDDTQITLSVARSLIAGDWEKYFAERELPFWLNYERGGGGALLRAAKSCSKNKVQLWQTNFTQGYFNAGGNGATMRILPHVIAAADKPNITALMLDVLKNTLITHGHPRAFLGATCYAYALNYLLSKETVLEYGELITAVIEGQKEWGASLDTNIFGDWLNVARQYCGYDFFVEWENTCARMFQKLEFIKSSLKKGLILDDTKVLTNLECFGESNGAGDVAALAGIYLASKYANNPVLGIKVPAFSFGADTDTIASITGGLLGMLNGTDWIPSEWLAVQDYDCLIHITELLLANNKKEATKAEITEVKLQNNDWITTQIGKMRLVDSKNVPNGKNGFVLIKKWQTVLGQTLYTKSFHPNDTQIQTRSTDSQIHQQTTLYGMNSLEQAMSDSKSEVQTQVTKPEQQTVIIQKPSRHFVLSSVAIADLLSSPQFKQNITVGKLMKIVDTLIKEEKESAAIAKKFGVEEVMIDLIRKYVID